MKELVAKLISLNIGKDEGEILNLITIPPSPTLGDYSFPCFVLAKEKSKNPVDVSKEIVSQIKNIPEFEEIKAVGPYVNFFINRNFLAEKTLSEILKKGDKYGSLNVKKRKVMIEFSQPNTHKAFHIGHIRGTSLGESLSRVSQFLGNKVIRANYSGDTGMHIAKWIWCYKNYHFREKPKEDESWIAGIYVDAVKRLTENEDLQKEVDEINRKIETKEDKGINKLWKETRKLSIKSWKKIYQELSTKFDVHYFESEVELPGKEIALSLLDKGLAKKSEDAVIMDLNASNLGVWILLRRDGTVLYSAKDLALAERKIKEYSADEYIVVVGDEQRLHFEQLLKTLEMMGLNKNSSYKFLTYGMVRLPEGKMSSRTGQNILYSDFMNEMKDYAKSEISKREKLGTKDLEKRALAISIAAIKYSMLKQGSNNVIVFSKEEALNFEGNTGPYLLYTFARAQSILRKAKYKRKSKTSVGKVNEKEKNLITTLSRFNDNVLHAYSNLSPNIVANYAYSIAQLFNEYYHSEQVIGSDNEQFRLVLVDCFSQVLKNSLNLLGISAIERM